VVLAKAVTSTNLLPVSTFLNVALADFLESAVVFKTAISTTVENFVWFTFRTVDPPYCVDDAKLFRRRL
jgi:hypothetical protein